MGQPSEWAPAVRSLVLWPSWKTIRANLRESAFKYPLKNLNQAEVPHVDGFLFVVVSRQTKKAFLCASAVKCPNPYLRKLA